MQRLWRPGCGASWNIPTYPFLNCTIRTECRGSICTILCELSWVVAKLKQRFSISIAVETQSVPVVISIEKARKADHSEKRGGFTPTNTETKKSISEDQGEFSIYAPLQ